MSNDEDIPVLTDAVRRKSAAPLNREQIDEICDSLAAETWVLIDTLIADALRDTQDRLRTQINDRLGDELPTLISKTLREKLGNLPDK